MPYQYFNKTNNYSYKLLNIFEFIEINNFNLIIKPWFYDLWFPLFDNKNILITNNIINFLIWNNIKPFNLINNTRMYNIYKRSILLRFQTQLIKFKIITLSDITSHYKYYYKFIKNEIEQISNNIEENKWILINLEDFKKYLLCFNTKRGKGAQNYFIQLEKILYQYSKYLSTYNFKKIKNINF